MISSQNELISESIPQKIYSDYQSILASILSNDNHKSSHTLPNNIWPRLQLFDCYHHLCDLLLNKKSSPFSMTQLNNGSIPLEAKGYISWAANIHQPFHSEMGVLLALYGHYDNKPEFINQAYKAALWQKQLLNYEGLPLYGVFTEETFASKTIVLGWSYLLFYLVGHLLQNTEMNAIAICQKKYLESLGDENLPALIPIIETLFPYKKISEIEFTLDEVIHDPLCRFIGHRDRNKTVISTLSGGKTGLGTFMRNNDLGFITFGPQFLPYGESNGYGIVASSLQNSVYPVNIQNLEKNKYEITGYARIPDRNLEFSYKWIKISQKYHHNQLDLSVNFLNMDDCKELSFIFYVSAKECSLSNNLKMQTKSFSKYKGDPVTIQFFNEKNEKIVLKPLEGSMEMEIIPLAGEDVFWSGDFLVGFKIEPFIAAAWSLMIE